MISVIVPVYNVEDCLQRCVDSLLNQDTDQPYEILLVDDGSTDRSGAMCDRFRDEHPDRIRVLHRENGGLSRARNQGVAEAAGELISFVDSDDTVSPRYLSVLHGLRERFGADMAVISVQKTLENQEILTWENRMPDFVLDRKEAFFEVYVIKRFGWYAVGKLYPKELLLKHPFPDGYYEDSATQYLLIGDCGRIAFGDYRAEYHYLAREASITTSRLSEKHFRIFDVCGEIGDYIDAHWPEWDYIRVLLLENAVLQLINRTAMTRGEYRELYMKYRSLFRKSLGTILRQRKVNFGSKYYAVMLCLTPSLYRAQRFLLEKVAGRRV